MSACLAGLQVGTENAFSYDNIYIPPLSITERNLKTYSQILKFFNWHEQFRRKKKIKRFFERKFENQNKQSQNLPNGLCLINAKPTLQLWKGKNITAELKIQNPHMQDATITHFFEHENQSKQTTQDMKNQNHN